MNNSMKRELEEREEWLQKGIDRMWITPPFCNTHDGDPYMSDEEQKEWDNGGDPCLHVVKFR